MNRTVQVKITVKHTR